MEMDKNKIIIDVKSLFLLKVLPLILYSQDHLHNSQLPNSPSNKIGDRITGAVPEGGDDAVHKCPLWYMDFGALENVQKHRICIN